MRNLLRNVGNLIPCLVLAAVVSAGVSGCGNSPARVEEPETTTPLPDDSMLRPIDGGPTAPAERNINQR